MTSCTRGPLVADLHMHSTCSDGCLTPEELCEHVVRAGFLRCIALTDHDTLAGAQRVCADGADLLGGIEVVPGVEISTQHDGRDVHMLGYFVDFASAGLVQMFEESRSMREARACAIADNLASDGYDVSGQDMRSSGKTVNRTLLARMLVERSYASDIDDAFARLIGRGCRYYVENIPLDAIEAVHLIREAGGYPFVAHPALYHVVDLVPVFKREGMAGLEAYHTLQSPRESEMLVTLACDEGLGVSGGSDWHGDATHGASLCSAGLDARELEEFLVSCDRG